MLIESERTVVCWAMGLTQHRHAVPMISEIANLLLLRGMIGKPGAGLCPVRGHSNVQGDRTMGIWEKMPEEFLAALDDRFGIVSPREHGVDTVDAIRAMRDGRAKVFMGMGGNFALGHAGHRRHRGRAAQLLADRAGVDEAEPQPSRARRDRADPAVAGPHRHATSRAAPNSRCRWRIRCRWCICRAAASRRRATRCAARSRSSASWRSTLLGPDHPVPWEQFNDDYDQIRDAIAAVVPGCDDYNTKVRAARRLPAAAPAARLTRIPHQHRQSQLRGRTRCSGCRCPQGRLVLQTLRSHDQYNTTIYGLDDRYRGVKGGRRVVFVNPADIDSFGLADGDRVDLVSEFTDGDGELQERRAKDFMVVPTRRRSATPPPTTRRPIRLCRWTTPRHGRIPGVEGDRRSGWSAAWAG